MSLYKLVSVLAYMYCFAKKVFIHESSEYTKACLFFVYVIAVCVYIFSFSYIHKLE